MNHVLDIAAQALIFTTLVRLGAVMTNPNVRLMPVPVIVGRSERREPGSNR
jgi:hypothetical protein